MVSTQSKAKDQAPEIAFGAIITDCTDENARARQQCRFSVLFGVCPIILGTSSCIPDVESAGNLVDLIDSVENMLEKYRKEKASVIIVNVEPRNKEVKGTWNNETPLCYFKVGNTLVVSTFGGRCLSLVRDLGLVRSVELLSVAKVIEAALSWGELTRGEAHQITSTQFRSFEFAPLVAYWILSGYHVPSVSRGLKGLPPVTSYIWHIDSFGNCKTTVLAENVELSRGDRVKVCEKHVSIFYEKLEDAPCNEIALIVGSSGYGNRRFLEIVVKGGSASKELELKPGPLIVFCKEVEPVHCEAYEN